MFQKGLALMIVLISIFLATSALLKQRADTNSLNRPMMNATNSTNSTSSTIVTSSAMNNTIRNTTSGNATNGNATAPRR